MLFRVGGGAVASAIFVGMLDAVRSKIPQFVNPFVEFISDVVNLDPVLLQLLVFGLLVGGIYALVALGLTMIYGVMDIINVAHGMFMGLGMYTVWFTWSQSGINPFFVIPLAVVLTFGMGVGVHRSMVEPLIEASASAQVLVLLGVLFIIQSGLQIFFNPDPRTIDIKLGSARVGSVFIPIGQLIALLIAITAVIAMWLLLYRTQLGRAIRATADDLDSARYRGINVPQINYLTFGIGAALAGLAGASLAIFQPFDPFTGDQYLLTAFIVAVLGGLGSFPGSLIAGFFLGMLQVFGSFYLPGTTSQIFILLIFIGTLLLRPEGLFGSVDNQ